MDTRSLEFKVAVDHEERGGFGAVKMLWLGHAVIRELAPVESDIAKDVIAPVRGKGGCSLGASVDDRSCCFQAVEHAAGQSFHFEVRRDGGKERTTDEGVLITGEAGDHRLAIQLPR